MRFAFSVYVFAYWLAFSLCVSLRFGAFPAAKTLRFHGKQWLRTKACRLNWAMGKYICRPHRNEGGNRYSNALGARHLVEAALILGAYPHVKTAKGIFVVGSNDLLG